MSDREKLENLKGMLDTLISTCESEITISNKILAGSRSPKKISKLEKEVAFWQGKLEVAKFAKFFAE